MSDGNDDLRRPWLRQSEENLDLVLTDTAFCKHIYLLFIIIIISVTVKNLSYKLCEILKSTIIPCLGFSRNYDKFGYDILISCMYITPATPASSMFITASNYNR